jgi:hypothetical protein
MMRIGQGEKKAPFGGEGGWAAGEKALSGNKRRPRRAPKQPAGEKPAWRRECRRQGGRSRQGKKNAGAAGADGFRRGQKGRGGVGRLRGFPRPALLGEAEAVFLCDSLLKTRFQRSQALENAGKFSQRLGGGLKSPLHERLSLR